MNRKEIAKFFAGFAASQLLTHGAFAIAGIRFTLFGINETPALNTIAAIAWGIIALLLIYYAWGRR